jgi:hypothetical protein
MNHAAACSIHARNIADLVVFQALEKYASALVPLSLQPAYMPKTLAQQHEDECITTCATFIIACLHAQNSNILAQSHLNLT